MHKAYREILIFACSIFVLLTFSGCTNYKLMQYRSYGIDYLDNMNYEEALAYFDEAIKLGDGAVGKVQFDLLKYKAECLFMLKRYDEAKKIYESLLIIDKNNKEYKELYNNVSAINSLVDFKKAIDSNDIEKADEMLNNLKALGLEHEKSVMFNQAVLYEKKSEWKNALNAFNYFLKQYPGDADAMHEVEFINAQLNASQIVYSTKKNDDDKQEKDNNNKKNAKDTNKTKKANN